MSLDIAESDEALLDVIEHADYIAAHGSLEASERVVTAIRSTYLKLADFPGLGVSREYGEFPGLRMFPVSRYPNYLIFYQADDHELTIRRVIHGARNIDAVFGETDEY